MRYLLISLVILSVSCGSYPKKQQFVLADNHETLSIPYFSNPEIDYIYKANIDVLNKHFGGLLIIKKTSESSHRIAFTTEMGNKIFDFTFKGDVFTVNFIPEELNKKMLLRVLEQDFRTLICEQPKITKAYTHQRNTSVLEGAINNKEHYFFLNTEGHLEKIVFSKKGKAAITYFYSKINSDIAQEIKIEHQSINMNITLKHLNSQ